jgi:isopropylmalate/homocitrate/citramalate synthase
MLMETTADGRHHDDLIWTGSLNEPARIGGSVGLYDTTLRDGEQTVGTVFSSEDKLDIARALDAMGIDRIEAGFPRVSPEDWRAVEMINGAGLSAEVWGFSRAVRGDAEALVEIGVSRTVIESPISDRKLDAMGVTRQTMLERIADTVRYATENGIYVAYFGVDGSRADPGFFEQAYKTAVDAGAREVVVVDTLGVATPEAVASLVARTADWFGEAIPVHFHGHNDFGLATASAVAAVRAGATWIHGTINGMGERAGNANLLEVALTLEALYGVSTNLRLEQAGEVSRHVRALAGYELEPWKPVVGENTFRRETGTVASQFHDPPAVEPYSSQLVGARRGIVLGKKSGLDSIRIKSAELGLKLDDEAARAALERVKQRGVEKRGLVSDDEFRDLAAQPD